MTTSSTAATVNLANGQSLALPDVRGTALMVTRGTLWVTQENDTQDVVLRAGDLWMVSRDGLTIIEAQNDASMRAVGPTLAQALHPRPRWIAAVRNALAAFFATKGRIPAPYY